jgi:hypothetical protein
VRNLGSLAILFGLTGVVAAAEVPAEAIAVKGRVVFSDDFERAELGPLWKVPHPRFAIEHGVLVGAQVKPDHGAVAQVDVGVQDLVLEFKFRLDGTTGVNAVLDDDNFKEGHGGHLCRVTLRSNQIFLGDDKLRFRHDIDALRRDPARKAEAAKVTAPMQQSIPVQLESGRWYKLTLEIAGDKMRAALDDRPVGFLKSGGIAHPVKGTFHLTVSGPDARFDDLKIWAAAASK